MLTKALKQIESMGVPVNSYVVAGQHMNQNLPSESDAKALIQELTNTSCSEQDKPEHYVSYVAAYLVTLVVKASIVGEAIEMLELLSEAKTRAETFLEELSWSFVEGAKSTADLENLDPALVKAGRGKKGAKKVLALKIFNAQIKDKGLTRKEAIAILQEEIGLTQSGASTYYHNFNSGKWS